MRDADTAIVWDVHVDEFTHAGHLQRLIDDYSRQPFEAMVRLEGRRNAAFLSEWERQIVSRPGADAPIPGLRELFTEATKLSGVLYVSQNHVLSEALFEREPEEKAHFTDRPLHPAARESLLGADGLTFSFPRLYDIEGFHNAWGFMRVERRDDTGNGAGVLLSVTTIDAEIMEALRAHGRTGLLSMYNHAWDGAIHDYLHHIALFTNPSFGIGKVSPMSLTGLQQEVDAWGEDMHSSFNYEYWAHRTHRGITSALLDDRARARVLENAQRYFRALRSFVVELAADHGHGYVQRVADYLACVYLWPMHVLLHPLDEAFDILAPLLDELHVDTGIDPAATAEELVQELRAEAATADPPRAAGLEGIAGLRGDGGAWTWGDVVRLKTGLVTQRGYYEGWFHDTPVMYQGRPVRLHEPAAQIIDRVQAARTAYDPFLRSGLTYDLRGIATALEPLGRSHGEGSVDTAVRL